MNDIHDKDKKKRYERHTYDKQKIMVQKMYI